MNENLVGRRILLVEDEMLVAWMLEDMLKDLGCTVIGPAASVAQALTLIDANIVDAATLDVSLNRELSYPIADVLIARGIPFLFSTGYDKDRLRHGYRSFPMLQKPFHPTQLVKMLAALFVVTGPRAGMAAGE
jgi:DNA-binding response OmpR family regulator